MKKLYDNHHILPRSRWWTNLNENIVRLDKRKHIALHMLFDNNEIPKQIQRLLDISTTALTEDVKSDIIKILNNTELDYWYKQWIYK